MYKNSKQIAKWSLFQGWGHWEAGGGEHALPPLTQFFHSKKKKGKEREKRKSFKTETIKNLSPRLKC